MPLDLARKLTPAVHAVLRCVERSRAAAVRLRSIRDFVLTPHFDALGPSISPTVLIQSLRAVLPDARFAVAASGTALEVFRLVDGLERLVEVPDPRKNLRGSVRALRAQRFFDGEPYISLLHLGSVRTEFRLAALLSGAPATVDLAGSQASPALAPGTACSAAWPTTSS